MPDNTQSNWVSKAEREPGGPNHWQWRTIWLNTSAPRRISILAGVLKPGSANHITLTCVQFRSQGMGWTGKFNVTLGRTIASTYKFFPPNFKGYILNWTIDRADFSVISPPSSTTRNWCFREKCNCCARCLATKDRRSRIQQSTCLDCMAVRSSDCDMASHNH